MERVERVEGRRVQGMDGERTRANDGMGNGSLLTSGPGHAVFIAGGTGPSLTSEPEIQSCAAKDANHDGRVIGARSPAASPRVALRSMANSCKQKLEIRNQTNSET